VAGDEVAGGAVEGDHAPVRADPHVEGAVVGELAPVGHVDALDRVRLPVHDVDVVDEVGIAVGHQVVREGAEGHEAAVPADGGRGGAAGGEAGEAAADQLGGVGATVVHEHVRGEGRVTGDEVRGLGGEGHEAAVAADVRVAQQVQPPAVGVALHAGGADAHAL